MGRTLATTVEWGKRSQSHRFAIKHNSAVASINQHGAWPLQAGGGTGRLYTSRDDTHNSTTSNLSSAQRKRVLIFSAELFDWDSLVLDALAWKGEDGGGEDW